MVRQRLSKLRALWNLPGGTPLILLAALAACSPRLFRGVSCGHDFDFHLVSWMEVERSWRDGVLWPHWAQSPNWGAGEPRFVFYPPVTWILGALLGYLFSWQWSPIVLTFFCLAAAGLATRALARQFLPASPATLAGILAACTPYALFTAYERTAFAELAASAGMPLILLYCLRFPTSGLADHPSRSIPDSWLTTASSGIPLALALAAVWLTNAPAGVIASYLLAFAALAAALLLKRWQPVLRAMTAVPLGLGAAGFYLVPAAWEQRSVAIRQAVDVGMRVRDSWLFARHPGQDFELHDQVLHTASTILVVTAGAAAAALASGLFRGKLTRATRHLWLPVAGLIPGVVLLQFPVSAPLWNHLPKLEFLQFPWRWLAVLGVPYAVFLACATPLTTRGAKWRAALALTTLLAAFIALATLVFVQPCDSEDRPCTQWDVFQAGTGVEGTDEYAPVGSDNSLVASGLPDACLVSDPDRTLGESDSGDEPVWYPEQGSCDDTFSAQLWKSEDKIVAIDSDHAGWVVLRLRRYPAWQVTVNGDLAAQFTSREDGLMAVSVPAGPSRIEIRWAALPAVWWGRGVSFASLLTLLALWQAERRARTRRNAQLRLSSWQWHWQ